MDQDDSRELLKDVLGYLAQRRTERATSPVSLGLERDQAWMRAKAYMQRETLDSNEISPEEVARALSTLENVIQFDSYPKLDTINQNVHPSVPYPRLQALCDRTQLLNHDTHSGPDSKIRLSKRKRDNEAVMDELSRLEVEAKKRRVSAWETPRAVENIDETEVDFAILMRKYYVSLHQGLRTQWSCICQKCSSLSVRLPLPPRTKSLQEAACFDVFFGIRSVLATTLQEANITVKDVGRNGAMSTSQIDPSVVPEFAHICSYITDSLKHRNCLHLLFEGGMFKRLRPKPKNFGDCQIPQAVSLSALFRRQQELRGGLSVLSLKGKRILAFVLANALLPFLETPWVQPSFNHSNIQFFQPLQDSELPHITKPFLDIKQVPFISGNKMCTISGQPESASYKHMVHPHASVLALGILLCELHYCTSVDSWQKDTKKAQDINASYYTSLDILQNLEVDAGVDYYLATKACLQWEYLPAEEPTSFESTDVQRLFYQNVIKRLESELFKSWCLRAENLISLDSRQNELCWGLIGREVLRKQASKVESFAEDNNGLAVPSFPVSDTASLSRNSPNSVVQMRAKHSLQTPRHLAQSGTKLFDATHQTISEENTGLSDAWMDNLLRSIAHHVDVENASRTFTPVRIAILDSGYDRTHPLLFNENGELDSRIKGARNFVNETEPHDIQDEIGHGTHALGLLLKVATCAEIYIAKIANQETLGRQSYDAITKAITYAATEWDVDVISMSFGIREYNEPMEKAMSLALHRQKLMFAAASNDGANFGRAFPAKYPGVFCIHSTDSNGNPSAFNPTADEKNVNFSLLGEHVYSHWPAGPNGRNEIVRVISGTSVATPIAAGLAAMILSLVRQQEQGLAAGSDLLGPWLKDAHAMDAVFKSMVRQRRGVGYDYITPHLLLDTNSSRESVYNKIKDIRKHMYD